MKEIGGYIELDTYHRPMLHEGAIALNCGRNALAYLIRARRIKRLWIPNLICNSVIDVCRRENVPYTMYDIGQNFLPEGNILLNKGEWLYFVNYYSQFDNTTISALKERYGRVIVDNAQSYFQTPLPGIDTIYTCRKWFGVPDGAFLYTDAQLSETLPQDESFERMRFLLGRFERSASEFYADYVFNNRLFSDEPIKQMSKMTANLLRAIDYTFVKKARKENYMTLHRELKDINKLSICIPDNAPFMYPLLLENGAEIRAALQKQKIYVPKLWPSVADWTEPESVAYRMAEQILPLPIDQRYGKADMERMIKALSDAIEIEETI